MKKVHNLKKFLFDKLFLTGFLVLLSTLNPTSVLAQTTSSIPCPEGTKIDKSGLCLPESTAGGIAGSQNLGQLLTKILELLLYVVGALAVVFIVIGGYQYITSHGNEEQAEKGKKTLVNSIIGLALVILAYMIVRVIANALTVDIVT